MELPDFSQAAESIKQYLPDVMYASVDEAARVNRERVGQNVAFYQANPEGLDARLNELSEEWDVDRILQVGMSCASLMGFWFSLTRTRLWLLLPLVAAGGALHHGVTGQSPAADLVRRLGFRTRDEIESEMIALQAVRGDYAGVTTARGDAQKTGMSSAY